MKLFYKIVASGFGSGFSPVAPGTVGSLLGCFIILFINFLFPGDYSPLVISSWLLIIVFFILGIFSINQLKKEWGHDSVKFTVDEMVGMWISVLIIPITWQNMLAGLVLFRFFDIVKPFWIRSLEKIHGGWGVMLDDVLAGIYANIVLQIYLFYI